MFEVFVSYSHSDEETADNICSILKELDIKFFRDEWNIGWGEQISEKVKLALSETIAIIVIISPGSNKSQWVAYEIGYVSGLEKKILPFITHPDLDLPGFIKDLKYYSEFNDVREYFEKEFESEIQRVNSTPDPTHIETTLELAHDMCDRMPELIEEMLEDVESDDTNLIREFVILPNEHVTFNSAKPRFAYFEDQHPNLLNKIDILEENGFIYDVTTGNARIYRMSEEFHSMLRSKRITS